MYKYTHTNNNISFIYIHLINILCHLDLKLLLAFNADFWQVLIEKVLLLNTYKYLFSKIQKAAVPFGRSR